MSGITFGCLTTDSDATTYYGMVLTDDYAINKYPNKWTRVVALVKSNTSPANSQSLTWSVVSKIGLESLTGQLTNPSELAMCAINSKGIFSLVVHFGFPSSGSPGSITLPTGPRLYQYDPNGKKMDASFNYKGTGSWSNVTIDTSDPTITGSWLRPQLQYANIIGVETLILTFIVGNDVVLVVLNEVTNTLAHAATWKMNATLYGEDISDTAIIGSHLYRIAKGRGLDHPLPYLSSFPISSTIPAAPPEGRLIDTSAFQGVNSEGFDLRLDLESCAGTLYVLAVSGSPYTKEDWDSVLISQTHYVDVAAMVGETVNVTRRFANKQYFVPINDGQFALVKINDQIDAITLSGSSFGNYYANIPINISDSIDPNFKFEAVESSGKSKVGLIVGITAAAVVLVGAGIVYFLWRKRSKKRAAGAAGTVTAAPALPPKDQAYIQGNTHFQKMELGTDVVYDDQPIAYNQTATHPGYIGATVAPPATATTMSGPPVQTFQNHMQGLQFSTHPRPNFITGGPSTDRQGQYGGVLSGSSGAAAPRAP